MMKSDFPHKTTNTFHFAFVDEMDRIKQNYYCETRQKTQNMADKNIQLFRGQKNTYQI